MEKMGGNLTMDVGMNIYDRIHELLGYNPKTGVFTWLFGRLGTGGAGSVAGYVGSHGYRRIRVDGREYLAHRLAWLYVYGYIPENNLDHINRVKDDNRIINLREVSPACNVRNTGNRCNNTSGVKGVSWIKGEKKWKANITDKGNKKHLGQYKDFADAVCARLAAEQCLNWSGCDSSSPAYKWVRDNILQKTPRAQ
jgi:hypothetical protein